VKPGKADETYEHGLLRVELPFKDPMEDAAKVAIKAGVAGWEFGEGQCEVCRVERDVG
jgi:HSP20 family molecular chaperone IbpA